MEKNKIKQYFKVVTPYNKGDKFVAGYYNVFSRKLGKIKKIYAHTETELNDYLSMLNLKQHNKERGQQ